MSSCLSATLVAVLLLSVAAPAAASHPALRCTAPDAVIRFTVTLPNTTRALRRGDALVIVAIGSSSTQGVGASDQAHTYPALLAEALRHHWPRLLVTVVNKGAGGFFADKELYLLRNLSKGRGVGFFEAGNFHPDFILWLLIGGRQHVIFLDPKGIRNLGPTDPKIQFHRTIKEIEQRLGDASVRVQSFIVSNTPSHTMQKLWTMDKPAMAARHILFQDEDQDTYVRSMLEAVGPVDMSTTADAVPS